MSDQAVDEWLREMNARIQAREGAADAAAACQDKLKDMDATGETGARRQAVRMMLRGLLRYQELQGD